MVVNDNGDTFCAKYGTWDLYIYIRSHKYCMLISVNVNALVIFCYSHNFLFASDKQPQVYDKLDPTDMGNVYVEKHNTF